MSAHRFFLTAPLAPVPGGLMPMAPADVHHAVDVLRLRVGETIDVVEPDGRVWRISLTEVGSEGVVGDVVREIPTLSLPRVTLFQGVAKGDKMDDIVRQAVEVGAEAIVPILTARSVVQLDERRSAQRAERWQRVALAAAKQSKRATVPLVSAPVPLRDALVELAAFDGAVVLWEECEGLGIASAVKRCASSADARVALIVGPEGGLATEEVDALVALGATPATLGPTILRTETAAIVALALAIGALGGLGGSDD
ncbi:MAG: 16S rRNA (uracil(1498)-N(3))-methyltransferase [Coriobacteriia bacterium]|nr:16S rRNA (uracil(1498)-N(3))-methyltransferase [Coriobacteriia bacterium]